MKRPAPGGLLHAIATMRHLPWNLALLLLCLTSALVGTAAEVRAATGRVPNDAVVNATVMGLEQMSRTGLLPIPSAQIKMLGPVIGCVASTGQAMDCAKEAVFERVLGNRFNEARPIVDCLLEGKNVADCATDAAIARLPGNGPALAQCVKNKGDPFDCAVKTASNAAEREAVQKFNEAVKTATDPIKGAPVINLIQAIQNEDWPTVGLLGGGEAAKVATCAVVKGLLGPGPHTDFLCEAGSNLIDSRIQSVRTFVDQAVNGDVGGLLGTLGKAGIAPQCAGLKTLDADVEALVCGNLGKLIDAGANEPAVIAVIASIATVTPLAGLGVLLLADIFGPDESCGTGADYYARNYPQCFHHAAVLGITDAKGLDSFANMKRARCIKHFSECDEDKAPRICDGITRQFREDIAGLTSAYQKLANGRAKGQKSDLERDRSRVCSASSPGELRAEARDGFLGGCSLMLQSTKKLAFEPDASCSKPGGASFNNLSGTVYEAACKKAADAELPKVIGEVCAGAGVCFKVCKDDEWFDPSDKKCKPFSIVN